MKNVVASPADGHGVVLFMLQRKFHVDTVVLTKLTERLPASQWSSGRNLHFSNQSCLPGKIPAEVSLQIYFYG